MEHHVLRGKSPDYVQVVFDIELRPTRFDVSVPKFLYNAKQGWTGALEGTASIHHNGFTLGIVSDGDELAERYAGLVARYENNAAGQRSRALPLSIRKLPPAVERQYPRGGRRSAGCDFRLYRTRQNFEPEITFALAKPLTLSVGTSFRTHWKTSFRPRIPSLPTP